MTDFNCGNCKNKLGTIEGNILTPSVPIEIRFRDVVDWVIVLPGQVLNALKSLDVRCICKATTRFSINRIKK